MPSFVLPPPTRQLYIHSFLMKARDEVLHSVVRQAAQSVPPKTLSTEMQTHAPANGLALLQGTNVRDELVFATPCILTAAPSALGYYRLLLGISQKQFYTTASGVLPFQSMEVSNTIRPTAIGDLPDLCNALNDEMTSLLESLPGGRMADDVEQLPLLTLGAQADGSWRNNVGQRATVGVYEALKSVIMAHGKTYVDNDTSLTITNSAGREVTIALAPDPDVVILEKVNQQTVFKVAIEIKGGKDGSNVHNRAGEAEKSHQKARAKGAGDCWTIISTTGASMPVLQSESPSTNHWFNLDNVLGGSGTDWDSLVDRVLLAMGI